MEKQIQLGLFSSADDRVCTDARGLLVAFCEELGKPIFIPSEGLWFMSLDATSWVQATGSPMGLDDGDVEIHSTENIDTWLQNAVMDEAFPSLVGTTIMNGGPLKVEVAGSNTLSVKVFDGATGDEVEMFFHWSVDGWTRIERSGS
jgi:hypothetical protein